MMNKKNGIVLGVANMRWIAWATARERGGAGRDRRSTMSFDRFTKAVEE